MTIKMWMCLMNKEKHQPLMKLPNPPKRKPPKTKKSFVDFNKGFFFGGERGIRTPGSFTFNGFQDRRIKPLCHFSGAKIHHFSYLASYPQNFLNFGCIKVKNMHCSFHIPFIICNLISIHYFKRHLCLLQIHPNTIAIAKF